MNVKPCNWISAIFGEQKIIGQISEPLVSCFHIFMVLLIYNSKLGPRSVSLLNRRLTEMDRFVIMRVKDKEYFLFSHCLEDYIMDDKKLLERIVLNPGIMVGKPVIRGTRLTVDFILNLLAHGASENDILCEYEGLDIKDIQACYLFATKSLENIDFMPLMVKSA